MASRGHVVAHGPWVASSKPMQTLMRIFRNSLLNLVTVGLPAGAAGQPSGAVVSYRVPVEAPTGDVQVLSAGSASLPVPSLIGAERFIHIRLAAHNQQDERDWVIDA